MASRASRTVAVWLHLFLLVGLRGAIPYALSLHLGLEPIEKRQLIGTTTIIIVLFTILLLGGGTMPLIRIMDIEESQSRRKNKKDVNLSKTQKMVKDEALCPRRQTVCGYGTLSASRLVLVSSVSRAPDGKPWLRQRPLDEMSPRPLSTSHYCCLTPCSLCFFL